MQHKVLYMLKTEPLHPTPHRPHIPHPYSLHTVVSSHLRACIDVKNKIMCSTYCTALHVLHNETREETLSHAAVCISRKQEEEPSITAIRRWSGPPTSPGESQRPSSQNQQLPPVQRTRTEETLELRTKLK